MRPGAFHEIVATAVALALAAGCSGASATNGGGSGAASTSAGGSSSGGLLLGSSGGVGSTGLAAGTSGSSGGVGSTGGGTSGSSTGTSAEMGSTGTAASSGTTGASSASSSSSSGGSSGGSTGAVNDGGYSAGTKCFTNGECASNLCKQVVENTYVCVTPCASQSDCVGEPGAFCEAISIGSASGYCIPGSPTTCANCTQDSDCGHLTEVCMPDPDGGADACHPDCSLAGDAGCPTPYSCQPVTVSGTSRQLCMPSTPSCLDETGGDCTLEPAAQACTRTNGDGTCTGQRTCNPDAGRFSDCGAPVPQQLATCTDQPPAGCTETTAPGATNTTSNCGTCGNVCPGLNGVNDVVTCSAQEQCTFACVGENYDADDNPADGCEVAASPQGDHTTNSAINLGAYHCTDSDSEAALAKIAGDFPSDTRVHENPAVTGFVATTGSAPDYWVITGEGWEFPNCDDDLQLYLTLSGSSNPACYQITVNDNDPGYPPTTWSFGASGILEVNPSDADNYNDGDVITIELSKICSTPPEAPTFGPTPGSPASHL